MKIISLSIKNKLILSITALIIFFGLLATLAVYIRTFDAVSKNKNDQLFLVAKSQTSKLTQRFDTTRSVLTRISHIESLSSFLENPSAQEENDLEALLHDQIIDERFLAIYILDAKGKTLVSTDERFKDQNYSFRNYYKQAMDTGWGIESAIGATSGELGLYFSRLITGKDGGKAGVAVVKVNPKNIESLIDSSGIRDADFLLTDSCGVVLFSSEEYFVYKSLGKLSETQVVDCDLQNRFPKKEVTPLSYGIVMQGISQKETSGVNNFYDEVDGEGEVLSYVKFDDYPFIFVIETNQDSLYEIAGKIALLVGIFVIVAAISALVIINLLIRRFLNPLSDLKTATEELTAGKFSHRIGKYSKDELGDLARIVDKMAGELQNLYLNFENKVREKTTELEKINNYFAGREIKMAELKKKIAQLEKDK